MSIYQALSLMIAFGILVATIFLALKQQENEPNIVCGPIFKYTMLRDEPTLPNICYLFFYIISHLSSKSKTAYFIEVVNSLVNTRWNYEYHLVFVPKQMQSKRYKTFVTVSSRPFTGSFFISFGKAKNWLPALALAAGKT